MLSKGKSAGNNNKHVFTPEPFTQENTCMYMLCHPLPHIHTAAGFTFTILGHGGSPKLQKLCYKCSEWSDVRLLPWDSWREEGEEGIDCKQKRTDFWEVESDTTIRNVYVKEQAWTYTNTTHSQTTYYMYQLWWATNDQQVNLGREREGKKRIKVT